MCVCVCDVPTAHRPPIEDVMNFLQAERDWIIDNLFAGRNIAEIAHGLVGKYPANDVTVFTDRSVAAWCSG